ncbi:LacI family DNA-binding transcriptional regulator [soil metagenome]
MSESGPPTLKDVADRAGVHVGTASRALSDDQSHLVSEETRARVRSAADALGYRTNALAQSLRKGTTGVVGVVVADLSNPFVVSLLRGVEHEARSRDVMPLVAETHDEPDILRSVLTRLLRQRVDAIILSAIHTTDEELVADLERRVPVVLAVRGVGEGFDVTAEARHLEVLQDDVLGARTAVNHLIGLGHRRIAQLPGNQQISSFAGRTEGYRAALAAHPDVEDVSTGAIAIDSTVAEGRRLATELLRRSAEHRPTAIFAHNDQMAVGALDALRDAGLRCPDDVSVVGYNDAPLSDHIDPPLTTVRLPSFELGRHSARLAFAAIASGVTKPERIVLAPEFIERKSTRAVGT